MPALQAQQHSGVRSGSSVDGVGDAPAEGGRGEDEEAAAAAGEVIRVLRGELEEAREATAREKAEAEVMRQGNKRLLL